MGADVHWDFGKVPMAVYTFKYRTRSMPSDPPARPKGHADKTTEDLQIEGVIERSPSPAPLEERDLETLSPEEMRELLRRQRLRAQDGPVKQEGQRAKRERSATIISDDDDNDSDGDEVEVTNEGNPSKRARAGSEIEIIDLSGL